MPYNYDARARELLLSGPAALAFIALNQHADVHGTCPSCGQRVAVYESTRERHARLCATLAQDVIAKNPNR